VYWVPGIGKSTLLRQAAFDVADEADGIVFVNATGRSHLDVPQEIFEACYETSGYRPSPTELRRLMTGVRGCVIVDDLVCSPDELTGVLDAAPDAAVVFAAPERELWGSGQVLALAGLSEEAALALVRREFGRDLAPDETTAVIAAWHSDGGSPMRLLRAAAAMSQKRTAAVEQVTVDGPTVYFDDAARIERGPRPAEAAARFDGATDPTVPLAPAASSEPAVSSASESATLVAALPAAERDVYQLLGFVAPAAASVEVIGALAHTSNLAHVTTAAERLVQIGLPPQYCRPRLGHAGVVVPSRGDPVRHRRPRQAHRVSARCGGPDRARRPGDQTRSRRGSARRDVAALVGLARCADQRPSRGKGVR